MDALNKFFELVDRLFSSIDSKLAATIRNSFFFGMFVLTVLGGVYGYRSGRESATIKSKPIIEVTNDAFDIDIKRERKEGTFSRMLESDLINEQQNAPLRKFSRPTQEGLRPDLDEGIIDTDNEKKIRVSPDPDTRDRLLEGDYRPADLPRGDVRPLERTSRADQAKDVREENPAEQERAAYRGFDESAERLQQKEVKQEATRTPDEKIKKRSDKKLKPIDTDAGIIDR